MACTFIIYNTNFYGYNTPKSYVTSLLAHQRSRPDTKKLLSTIKSPKVKDKLSLLFSLIGEIKQHVTISVGKFSLSKVTLEAGDIVMWINNTTRSHTVTSGIGTNDPNRGKLFDSYEVMNRKPLRKHKIFLHPFTDIGKYGYFCKFHRGEIGTIIVRSG
jgi:plastocyanin